MSITYETAALRLRRAYTDGAIAPLRDVLSGDDGEGAYAIQHANTRHWLAAGRRIVGRKIGLTSKIVQAQLGVGQPDFGVLFDDMVIDDGGSLDIASVLQPRAEAEVALVLGRDIADPDVTLATLTAAVDHAVAAIEIVDSRIADWKIGFADTVADNGSSAFFVLGSERKPLDGLDLYTCGMAMEINGEIASVGAGAACLGHPLNAALWLARTLVANGERLSAGDIMLTGALGPMAAIKAGDTVRAQIGGVGACTFSVSGASA